MTYVSVNRQDKRYRLSNREIKFSASFRRQSGIKTSLKTNSPNAFTYVQILLCRKNVTLCSLSKI